MKLTEIKTETQHYFKDEHGKRHGEYKYWHYNGQLYIHTHNLNGKVHGEFKHWYENGQL